MIAISVGPAGQTTSNGLVKLRSHRRQAGDEQPATGRLHFIFESSSRLQKRKRHPDGWRFFFGVLDRTRCQFAEANCKVLTPSSRGQASVHWTLAFYFRDRPR